MMTLSDERLVEIAAEVYGGCEVGNVNVTPRGMVLARRIRDEAYRAGLEEAARLHEMINPASDAERLENIPGAGAMGAIIDYRDAIRARIGNNEPEGGQ